MRFSIVGLITLLAAQSCAACEPVPSTWHLGKPVDVAELPAPATSVRSPYSSALSELRAALRPGEKVVPYSGLASYYGQAGGTSGYAIIRNGCVVKTLITEAI